jgi:hypothetical protein
MNEDCKKGNHEYIPWDDKWVCAFCGQEPPSEQQAYGTDCKGGECE